MQQEICRQLRLNPQRTRTWVTSFERPNLHFSVHKKDSLDSVLAQLVAAKKRDGQVEPTLVYTMTVAQVSVRRYGWKCGEQRCVGSAHKAHAALPFPTALIPPLALPFTPDERSGGVP